MIRDILLLGNPQLYEVSRPVTEGELKDMERLSLDMHDTLTDFRQRHGAGRAIAAPQVGVMKRLIYMCVAKPVVFLNPVLEFLDDEMMDVLDDCMSFPDILVAVRRYRRLTVRYKDLDWNDCIMELEGDLSELIQHEYDHLDGILAVMRAKDDRSLYLKSMRHMYRA